MFQDRQIMIIIKIAVLVFIVLSAITILNTLKNKELNKQVDKKEPILSLTTDSNIFKVDSVLLYCSANALNNSEMQEDYWDLNLYQYTDMAITIDNHVSINGLTQKNTIKEMYIDNVTYPTHPSKGNPSLYYKDSNFLGVGVINEEYLITDKLNFNVLSSNDADVDYPFYADCSNPILLSAINEDIVPKFVIRNTNSAITFNGSLLVDADVLVSSIQYSVSFAIHIVNNLDEEYVCNLTIPIKLQDENELNTIHDGSYQTTLDNLSTSKFYKIEEN